MSIPLRLALYFCLILALPLAALAESDRDNATKAMVGSMPARGMTMDQVGRYFGQPAQRFAPVGEPPISRWQYDGMMVYFENQRVIHAVATNGKPK